ncbi:hypothetical protein BsWGS_25809 [Bradybaena similaris]
MPAKSACVVGAGVSGIAALKECKRQGFRTTCYELDSDIGGIWHKKDHSPANTVAIWETLVTNVSKFNCCFTDFPPDVKDTVYLSTEATFKYLKRAVDHFGLEEYIQFNTRVIKIRKTSDHDTTGRWEVFTAKRGDDIAGDDLAGPRGDDLSLSRCHREVFDFVIACTGNLKLPFNPAVPGIDEFGGFIQHAFGYTSARPYEGKNVLVVGNKFSAIDIAVDIANRAQQVYLSLGEGTWMLPRCFPKSRPYDTVVPRSLLYARNAHVKLNDMFIEAAQNNLDHETSGIRPDRAPLFAPICLSDEIPLKLMSGKVKAYGHLAKLEHNRAHMRDGQVITDIDAIVFCTGYKPDFSFVESDILEENGKMKMYRMVFPLEEKHTTLAFVGQVTGDFAVFPLYDVQAKLATRVMAGKHRLPSLDKMKADVDFWNAHSLARTGKYSPCFVAAAVLTDTIAEEIGIYPSFWKVFFKNPVLAFRNWYGPIMAAQLNLVGPDSQWETASAACLSQYSEGCSSFRHTTINTVNRPDLYEYQKSRLFALSVIGACVSIFGFLCYRNQETIISFL